MHIFLSEVDAYSISVLGEENWVFLRSGSPDHFETPAFGLDELWPGSGSLSPCLTTARVPGSVLGISALQLPVSGWANSTLPPLPAGIQLQHFACCLQLCRYCFQKHLLGETLNSRSAWKVNFEENNFQQKFFGDSCGVAIGTARALKLELLKPAFFWQQ